MTYRWTPINEPRERRHWADNQGIPFFDYCILPLLPPRRRYGPPFGFPWQRRLTATKRLQAARRGAK